MSTEEPTWRTIPIRHYPEPAEVDLRDFHAGQHHQLADYQQMLGRERWQLWKELDEERTS